MNQAFVADYYTLVSQVGCGIYRCMVSVSWNITHSWLSQRQEFVAALIWATVCGHRGVREESLAPWDNLDKAGKRTTFGRHFPLHRH